MFLGNMYFPCLHFHSANLFKVLIKIILGRRIFICEPIFKIFVALFKTFRLQKADKIIFVSGYLRRW